MPKKFRYTATKPSWVQTWRIDSIRLSLGNGQFHDIFPSNSVAGILPNEVVDIPDNPVILKRMRRNPNFIELP